MKRAIVLGISFVMFGAASATFALTPDARVVQAVEMPKAPYSLGVALHIAEGSLLLFTEDGAIRSIYRDGLSDAVQMRGVALHSLGESSR